MDGLAGSTAVLIGARGLVGLRIAEALAEEGMNLVLASRSTAGFETMATKRKDKDIGLLFYRLDVTDHNGLVQLVHTAERTFKQVDLLVYNAGIEAVTRYEKSEIDDIEHLVQVNLIGAMVAARAVLPKMLGRHRGHIVNICSLAGKIGPPYIASYAATKAGLIRFTQSIRSEYLGSGVSASAICPGFITSGMTTRLTEEAKIEPPSIIGVSSPDMLARKVVRAIKHDVAETIINPGPARLFLAITELFPMLTSLFVHRSGLASWYQRIAEARSLRQND